MGLIPSVVFSGVSRRCICELAATELSASSLTPASRLTFPPETRLNCFRAIRPIRVPPTPVVETRGTFAFRIVPRLAAPDPPRTVPMIDVKTLVLANTRFRLPLASSAVPVRLPGPFRLIRTFAPSAVV